MKKNFKFMLVALLTFFGFNSVMAQQLHQGGTIVDNYYKYTFLEEPQAVAGATKTYAAPVQLTEVVGEPVLADLSIYMPENGVVETSYGAETYQLTLVEIKGRLDENDRGPLENLSTAKSIIFPATITAIPEYCFNGCSDMESIVFEGESQVETIGSHAFATTKIRNFDFSPCELLEGLPDEVFVEPGLNNTYITKVKLPTEPAFKHINGAFRNLTNLGAGLEDGEEAIENLGESFIQEIVLDAFDGCENLTAISLPGNDLRYIDQVAFRGSAIETLNINVNSLLLLGGCSFTKNEQTGEYTLAEAVDQEVANLNLYGFGEESDEAAPLTTLTLTGELKGKISTYAFAWCTGLEGILDFSEMDFGSTGQIMTDAFLGCTGVEGVTIGNIPNNSTGGYTIEANAFEDCDALATVTIGNITALQAIGSAAFGNQLKDVTIGTVYTSGAAFAAAGEETLAAFVWGNFSDASLTIANGAMPDGTKQYISQSSANAEAPAIPAGAFDFSAVDAENTLDEADPFIYPAVTIGEIKSKGGAFAEGAIIPAADAFSSFVFAGDIAANGIDKALIAVPEEGDAASVTALTFKGVIGIAGIATGAFANETAITTITFNGVLAEGAVASGAFNIENDNESDYALNYVLGAGLDIKDYSVNPFAKNAFNAEATTETERFIVLTMSTGTKMDKLKANFEGAKGLTTDEKFDIYLVMFAPDDDEESTAFIVYQNGNTTNAWGRYDLGSFQIEKGPDYDETAWENIGTEQEPNFVNTTGYQAANMVIDRYQEVLDGDATVKLTLYGMYGDSNASPLAGDADHNGESLVYMVPLQVIDGKYYIPATNQKTIIVKADAIDGAFTEKDIPIAYTVADEIVTSSVWEGLPDFGEPRAFNKNMTNDVITTQILWDGTQRANYDVWGAGQEIDHDLDYAPLAIYSLSNPDKYQGVQLVKLLVSENSGKIGINWYYMLMPHFGKTANEEEAARIIWLDDAQATAIFGVKDLKAKAKAEDGAIYNLQGVRVNKPSKGLYIMNGKKYVVK